MFSENSGLQWQPIWSAEETGRIEVSQGLRAEVNGAYEILLKVSLQAA